MAYSKQNKYNRIMDVQRTFREHYKPGMTIEHIYQQHIREQYRISRTTFFAWLKVDAAGELARLTEKENERKARLAQLQMFS